jgi:putative glutamine amidotransferase
MFTEKPLIGITGPDEGGGPSWYCARFLIWLGGGKSVRITPSRPHGIEGLHGLILSGGADIDPGRYGEEILPEIKSESRNVRAGRLAHFLLSIALWLFRRLFSVHHTSKRQDLLRDELEFGLLKKAIPRHLPVLGICRGGQLINVHFGGALYQDISTFYVEKPNLRTVRARKLVRVEPGSTLHRLVCRSQILVNSLHHQSVKSVGHGLRACAHESNGIIQAVEHIELPFVLGVQWHPEFLLLHPEERRIFHHLVDAAKVFRVRSPGSLPPDLEFWNLAQN